MAALASFAVKSPATVRAECAARDQRVTAEFDSLDALLRSLHERMAADGLFRPATARTRLGEAA